MQLINTTSFLDFAIGALRRIDHEQRIDASEPLILVAMGCHLLRRISQ